jgi:TRAP transporter TAXI family solute receptor
VKGSIKMKRILCVMSIFFVVGLFGGTGIGFAADKNISIGTGAMSGTYYPLGVAMAKMWSGAKIGINVGAEATGGSVENARHIKGKTMEVGFVESLIADWAYTGQEMFKDNKVTNIRGLISLYPNTIQTVVKADSGIKSYADLKGKKVSCGIQGSSSVLAMRVVLETYGITFNEIKPQYLAFGPAMELLKDGQVDAVLVDSGAPSSSIIDIASQHKIKILSIDRANIAKVVQKYPYFSTATVIPKGTYSGIDEDIVTTGSLATLCVAAEMSDDLVYKMTKALIEKRDEVSKVHEKGKTIDLKTAVNGFSVPLHPGALKYYKEKGAVK